MSNTFARFISFAPAACIAVAHIWLGADGNSGWGYLPGGAGAQCQNSWVVCGSANNAPRSHLNPENYDAGGWVSAPGQTGAVCQNPGVVCTNVG